jgi:putative heme-binding domain-containing protein
LRFTSRRKAFYRWRVHTRFVLPSLGALVVTLSVARAANDPFAENVRTTDPLPAEEQQRKFHAPPGFEVQLVAAEPQLRKPMNMQFDTAGRLWFTESREYPWPTNYSAPRDTIRILSDFDDKGRAHKVTVFATNLNIPTGLYPFQTAASDGSGKLTWKCIAWSIPNIWLFEDTDGDGTADKKEKWYGPFDHTRDTHGNQSSFRRGFDGWLYATHGFNNDSHVTARDGSHVDMNSGNTYRIRLDGSRIEHHTWGQVNPFGMAWDEFANLYSSDCHSAPTYQLLAGGYYPSFGKPNDGLGFAPVLMEHSHGSTAIDGMLYYADDLWPAEFRTNIFVGNVMTSRVNRDRLTFNGSSPHANELDDFVKCDDPWFRPVDNRLGPDGAFYIADFYNRIIGHYEVPLPHPGRDRERGRIWRVVYKGTDGKAKLRPRAIANDLDGMIKELASGSLARRMLAMNAIDDRFGKSAAPKLRAKWENLENEFQQLHILWLLHRLDGMESKQLLVTWSAQESILRVHAARIAAGIWQQDRHPHVAKPGEINLIAAADQIAFEGLKDRDPLVARCAAEAMGNLNMKSSRGVRALLDLRWKVPAADTHLLYTVRKALRDQLRKDSVFSQVLADQWTEQENRGIADVCVAVTNSNAASFLLSHLQKYSEPRKVTAPYLQHAARFLPADRIDDLSAFVQEKFGDDMDFQWALFKPIVDGLAQRGVAPSNRMKRWGNGLAEGLVKSVQQVENDWTPSAVENAPNNPNPWVVQNRACNDGKNADFLCTLPSGEGSTGALRSKPFTAPATFTFWMAGHDGFPEKALQKKNFVQLRSADTDEIITNAPAPRHDVARPTKWKLGAHAGKRVVFEMIDSDTAGAYAWLAVGRFQPALVSLPKITPKLVDERLQAAAQIALATREKALEAPLTTALKVASSLDTRAAVATTLLALNKEAHVAICAELLNDAAAPSALRVKVAQALSDANTDKARAALISALRTAPERYQPRFAAPIVANKAGAEALLREIEAGKLPARLLQDRTLKEKIVAAKISDVNARLAKLTKNLTPLNEELQKQIEQRRAAFKPSLASAARGPAVFERVCAGCHQLDGKGAVIGPQLDGIGARGLERIVEDVVDPNRNVDHAFRATNFILNDDDVVSGLFRREEGEQIVYADATGKEHTLAKKQIKQRRESELSLMPEGIADGLQPQEFNDLMAFLLTKNGAKKQ